MVFLSAIILFAVLAYLRHTKGVMPLRRSEGAALPGFPGPRGLVVRLDGMERKQRVVIDGRFPGVSKDGSLVLPLKWEKEMTVGRMAAVAHTWGLGLLAEDDPVGAKSRENAILRTAIITFFVGLIALAMVFIKHVDFRIALAMIVGTWAFLSFAAIPSQYREWKARDLAKQRLKEAGLWPQLPQDGRALESCLDSMIWCRVAGFRRILPK